MDDTQSLADELSELFRENVSVGEVNQREFAGARIAVATMSYRSGSDSSTSGQRFEQTVVVLDDEQVDVPEFVLAPRLKGLLGKILSMVGGLAAVEFDDPEFSRHYMLRGWADEPIRILFTKSIRHHLAKHPGWSVRGKRHRLVIFKSNEVCEPTEVDDFTKQSLQILTLFQEGEEALDERPDIRREARPSDVARSAAQVGGLAGAILQKQLRKIAVTADELERFVASAPPRELPPGIRRQVLGETFPLVIVGLLFLVGGTIGGILWIILAEGIFKLFGIFFLTIFPIAGFLMAFLTLRHRQRKTRTLRSGIVTEGTVTSVERSNVEINNQRRFHVTISYPANGRELSTTCNVYGIGVDQLRMLSESGQPTRLLIDPEDDSHVISLDQLVVFDP